MIITFNIFEKLGYNQEISDLTEYVWKKYLKGERTIDLDEYCNKNMSIYLKTLYIEDFKDSDSDTIMKVLYNNIRYRNSKSFVIMINTYYKPSIISFEHEIKHMYDFIKRGGKFRNVKDKSTLANFLEIYTDDDNISKFLYIMYVIEMSEIEGNFHADVRNFKMNKNKFKKGISRYIKSSKLNTIYEYIVKNDISKLIANISYSDKQDIMTCYYEQEKIDYDKVETNFEYWIKSMKNFLKIAKKQKNNYTEKEVNDFFGKIEKEVEKKKKIYLRYIGRLYAIFH